MTPMAPVSGADEFMSEIVAKDSQIRWFPDPGGRRPRINPRAETRREKGWSRQPEPDALEHEGLWSEPTSSTGCEVMRSSGCMEETGSRFGSKRQRSMRNAEMIELDWIHPM